MEKGWDPRAEDSKGRCLRFNRQGNVGKGEKAVVVGSGAQVFDVRSGCGDRWIATSDWTGVKMSLEHQMGFKLVRAPAPVSPSQDFVDPWTCLCSARQNNCGPFRMLSNFISCLESSVVAVREYRCCASHLVG